MKAVLDAGALVAIEKRDRKLRALLRVLQQQGFALWTSAAVVAQVWRDGRKQALLAAVLAGVGVRGLVPGEDRRIGELLARTGSKDVIDAHVALIADDADLIVTSDPDDIARLLDARGVSATLVSC